MQCALKFQNLNLDAVSPARFAFWVPKNGNGSTTDLLIIYISKQTLKNILNSNFKKTLPAL